MKTTITLLFILTFSLNAFGQLITAVVTTPTGLVLDQPDAKAKVIRKLKRGAKFTFHEADTLDGFCYIILDKGGFRGWLQEKSFKRLKS